LININIIYVIIDVILPFLNCYVETYAFKSYLVLVPSFKINKTQGQPLRG